MNDFLIDAYCTEKTKIQSHYQHVIQELDIVRNSISASIASNELYEPILRAMVFIRTQMITNINFEVKEFNQFTSNDIPISYYPGGSGPPEIAKLQKDIKLLDQVVEGKIFGNIFSARSLLYIDDRSPDGDMIESIVEEAAQIFPLTLEQFGAYVDTIANAIHILDKTVEIETLNLVGNERTLVPLRLSREDLTQIQESTMKDLNINILRPMNEWRTEFLNGMADMYSEVAQRAISDTESV